MESTEIYHITRDSTDNLTIDLSCLDNISLQEVKSPSSPVLARPSSLNNYSNYDCDLEYTSQVETDDDSRSDSKSSRNDLDSVKSAADQQLVDSVEAEDVVKPEPSWLSFLNREISSTTDDYIINQLVLVLKAYLTMENVSEEAPKDVPTVIDDIYDSFLLDPESTTKFSAYKDLDTFLWLVWGALLEVVTGTQSETPDGIECQNRVVALVAALLDLPEKKYPVFGVC